ncbi:unnamed protein product [Didymodactylos carnosus]|uniref:Acyltransferase n=1 Tax=Didymodactylos carnosus TaxID=1234261 RepID=A0A8S2EJR2_9BILA|nr:unnamed protein product [Didymodactylos carnosus]CAF4034454.1 unnamed protein product [Didymodactylos carnosus]
MIFPIVLDKMRAKVLNEIGDLAVRQNARRFSKRTQLAFLSDEQIGGSWFFRLFTFIRYYLFTFVHAFEIVGQEKLEQDTGVLMRSYSFMTQPRMILCMISRHTTHCADVLPLLISGYHITGRVTRGLMHRLILRYFPLLRWLGSVPGERESAEALLEAGFLCGVIPGGGDEGMVGHENAYVVRWPKKRKGFAHIAMKAHAPIIPCFLQNQEEMRFNPLFALANLLRIGHFYSYIMLFDIPYIKPLLYRLGMGIWFSCTWFQLPIPVKLTLHIGDPVEYGENDTIDDVVQRSRNALQALINKHQPHGKSYLRAIKQRIDVSTNYWRTVLSTRRKNF